MSNSCPTTHGYGTLSCKWRKTHGTLSANPKPQPPPPRGQKCVVNRPGRCCSLSYHVGMPAVLLLVPAPLVPPPATPAPSVAPHPPKTPASPPLLPRLALLLLLLMRPLPWLAPTCMGCPTALSLLTPCDT